MHVVQGWKGVRAAFFALVAIVSLSVAGSAAAQVTRTPTTTPGAHSPTVSAEISKKVRDAQPSKNHGMVAGLISATGLLTAHTIGSSVSSFAATARGIGSGSFAAAPGTQRFALPGQGETGSAAAPGGKAWNAWVSYGQNRVSYNFEPLQSGGTVDLALVGVDYTFDNNAIVGVALSNERTKIDLSFIGGTLKGRGDTVSPYVAVPIGQSMVFDATIGFGRTRFSTDMLGISGSTRDTRELSNIGLSYRQAVGNFLINARGAYVSTRDKLAGYTLSDGTAIESTRVGVSQVRVGAQATYNGGWVLPHFGINYIVDTNRPTQQAVNGQTPANDRDAWQTVVGAQFRSQGALYGGVQYSVDSSRSQVKNSLILLNLGMRF